MSKNKKLYNENSIITETPREFTRRVPSTYLGSSIYNTNLVNEIIANSIDEHTIGHGDIIDVNINDKTNTYCVEDNGQGFLVNAGIDEDGETILQRSFDRLNTSGKTSVDGVYSGSALGLNGIGAKLTNWLSLKLNVITYRDNEYEELDFKDGLFINRKVGTTKHNSGTKVTWKPDPQFFKINKPDMTMLSSHFETLTAFCPKLTINTTYNGKLVSYHEKDGLNSYMDSKIKDKELFSNRFITERSITINDYVYDIDGYEIVINENQFNNKGQCYIKIFNQNEQNETGEVYEFTNKDKANTIINKTDCIIKPREEKINIGITYTSDYSENINAYVNLGKTDSGTHFTAFHTAFTKAINKYAIDTGLLKKNDKNFNNNEICEGLYVIFNITTTTAKYDAQNKSRIDDMDSTIIHSVIGGDFATWLINNPDAAKIITERALVARKAREAAKKAKDKIRDASNGKGKKSIFTDLPSKLADAYPKNRKDRSKCELYIVEGDSAASSINATKDSTFQACFPIRGKILCCQKATPDKVFANAEISNITKALGLDIDKNTGKLIYDKKKLRYNKIIISSDEDADGYDIALLLLTVFNWLCPELIENGHIYRVHGALFKATFKDGTYKLFQTDLEFENWKKINTKSYELSRAKGLGELTKEETYEQLVNPYSRDLVQLYTDNMEEFNEYLEIFKGSEVAPRRKYLEEHFNDY